MYYQITCYHVTHRYYITYFYIADECFLARAAMQSELHLDKTPVPMVSATTRDTVYFNFKKRRSEPVYKQSNYLL
jgi:hypothetical protein